MKAFSAALILFFVTFSSAWSAPRSITLSLPAYNDNSHLYYYELLTESLADIGVKLNIITPAPHVPQRRGVKMLEKAQLSALWLFKTEGRDLLYYRVDVPLTNGLIGRRIMLIPRGAQRIYDPIRSLQDIRSRALVAGLGVGWFDADVWQANELDYYLKDGEWRHLYRMLSNDGGVNYFPRGVNEIVNEAKRNLHLDIEKNLILEYDRDFVFYLSAVDGYHVQLLEKALRKAQSSGLMQRLIEKHWGETFKQLDLDSRTVIKLDTPMLQ